MSEYSIMPLAEILEESGESGAEKLLSSFSCPINKDVETFLLNENKAINMERQRVSVTYLVFYKEIFCAYFTLASKIIAIEKGHGISNKTYERITKFGTCDNNICTIPSPLIAQLGKNYTDNRNELIDGDTLLDFALMYIKDVQKLVGGKVVYIECKDEVNLVDFYSRNGFVEFGRRELDPDEIDENDDCKYLLRMLKYLG